MTSRSERSQGTNLTEEEYFDAYGGPGYNAYVNEPLRYGVRLHYGF